MISEAIAGPLAEANDVIDRFEGSSEELLRALVDGFRAFEETPAGGVVKLILAEAGNFPDVAKFYCTNFDVRGRDLFIRTLRRGVENGEFRPFDPEVMVHIVFAPLIMRQIWKHSLDCCGVTNVPLDDYLREYLELTLRGLRRDPT